jgi:peptidylprolyl isomerase
MPQAQRGDKVRIHYTGTLEDGEVFDSSEGQAPLEFTLGGGEVIPGFEAAIEGMAPGERKTVTIPADEAYGPHREEMLLAVPREQFPAEADPHVGDALLVGTPDGQQIPVTIFALEEDTIVLDANHPLAGEDLTFELELVEIAGQAGGSGLVGLDGKPLSANGQTPGGLILP